MGHPGTLRQNPRTQSREPTPLDQRQKQTQSREQGEAAMNTPTETLIKVLRVLASDIQSEDGVANAAILEAAQRMEEDQEVIFQAGESIKILRQTVQHRNDTIDKLKKRIKQLETERDEMLADQCYKDTHEPNT
jgi:phosphoenolpyruvate-protein kinase (PTS system EI component)